MEKQQRLSLSLCAEPSLVTLPFSGPRTNIMVCGCHNNYNPASRPPLGLAEDLSYGDTRLPFEVWAAPGGGL